MGFAVREEDIKSCGVCGHGFSDDDVYNWFCDDCQDGLGDHHHIDWHVDITTKNYTFFVVYIENGSGERMEEQTGADCDIDKAAKLVYNRWMDKNESIRPATSRHAISTIA